MSESRTSTSPRRTRVGLPVAIAGALASLVLALGISPSLAAFTASIANTVDTAGMGTLTMQEANAAGTVLCNSTDGGSVSTNAATCTTINKYGGNLAMVPGQTVNTSITIKNTGTVPASTFSLTPGACAQSANGLVNGTATDLCSRITVVVTSGATTIYNGSLAGFSAAVNVLTATAASSVPAGASVPFTFAVTLPAALGNTYAGLQVSQPLTWTFGS
ncbi:hypothetical protein [Microbacterium sp. RU33B]|uniref:hypothetical protein n=1 Tax=Microbacterium sp. RU33B TaxID=1907390 RepID=UPI000960C0D1|nr:hypothetical protein [Microbacterium sp. RU33B]SIT68209.1 hypothetical protein SAMN05880545_0331 [Microbacterium sp. RU33B]